jgi:methylated-DNA-[protein]-cysteine S-methyltransferase
MSKFFENVYKLCKKVPKGKITTYKAIANKLGSKAYRAVGTAMNKNPYGILNCKGKNMVPCHRVVGSTGHLIGFAHGLKKKAELLSKEGIKVKNNKIENFDKVLYKF